MGKLGLLLAIGVSDAYGAQFEFKDKEFIKKNNKLKYLNKIGTYTDDTEMSIAITNHMLYSECRTHYEYMNEFICQYNQGKHEGYSTRTKSLLGLSEPNEALDKASNMPIRNSNGCVMRCLPLGLYSTPELVKRTSLIQATTTHPTIECILATQCVALMSHYIYHNIYDIFNKKSLKDFLCEQLGEYEYYKILYTWKGNEVPCDAMQTASFVLQTITESFNRSLKEILKFCISVGGDTDSIAALTVGLLSLRSHVENNLPENLINNLENEKYGKDILIELDKRLMEKFPRNNS